MKTAPDEKRYAVLHEGRGRWVVRDMETMRDLEILSNRQSANSLCKTLNSNLAVLNDVLGWGLPNPPVA